VLAKEMKIIKLGTVSVDGSKIKANASIHKSIRYDRARELEQELKLEIDKLLARAEEDKAMDEHSDEVDAELEREGYEKKVCDRNDGNGKSKGPFVKEPKGGPVGTAAPGAY
jgi:hypothetical protein